MGKVGPVGVAVVVCIWSCGVFSLPGVEVLAMKVILKSALMKRKTKV